MAIEVDFLPVGSGTKSGDAICMRYSNGIGSFDIHIVDGGYTETGLEIVDHINNNYGNPVFIDHVVLTHPDSDHVSGLFEIFENFRVGTLWMNRPWLHASEIIDRFHGNWSLPGLTKHLKEQFSTLVELEEIAVKSGTNVYSAFQNQIIGKFTVLAPSRERYLNILVDLPNTPAEVKSKKSSMFSVLAKVIEETAYALVKFMKETWYGESLSENPVPTSPSNESSIVQGALIDGKRILLTGDTGPAGLAEAFLFASKYGFTQPDLIQVPHHGSRRNVTPSVLNDWLGSITSSDVERGLAVCSAAKDDLDHPKAKVENAFLRRGYPVYSTKGKLLYWSQGVDPRNYSAAVPAPFRENVEE